MLRQYQEDSLNFILQRDRTLLADDTGLGKTLICIEAAKRLKLRRVLVICPAFLRENWRREVEKWKATHMEWDIVSYEGASKMDPPKGMYDLMICDEAHYLKNWSANRTKNILLNIAPRIPKAIFSTATPYMRSAADLHPLFSVCEPGKWGKFGAFCDRYCLQVPDPYSPRKFRYVGFRKSTVEEVKRASSRFMIRHKKSDVLTELPEKIISMVPLEVDTSSLEDCNIPPEEVFKLLAAHIEPAGRLSTAMRAIGLLKVPAVVEWAQNLGEQAVIFAWHRDVLHELSDRLSDTAMLIGDMPEKERYDVIDDFQAGKTKILLASIAAAGVGINLTAARIAAFIELPWNPASIKQCEDRLHRMGQLNAVNVYRFYAENTIDKYVLSTLSSKIQGEHLTVGNL